MHFVEIIIFSLKHHTERKSKNMNKAKYVSTFLICDTNNVVEHYGKRIKILHLCPSIAGLTGHSQFSQLANFCQNGLNGSSLLGQPSKGHPYRILILFSYCLAWPHWWSFVDVIQQGLDFSKKKISKRKISFWFDFHRCSHGSLKSA